MSSEIILRPATFDDAQVLAQLWAGTFPDKFGPILGDKAERVLCDWLRLSERHLQTTTLAEIGEAVAGFMVLETPSAPRTDDGRWMWHALQLNNGIFGALRGMLLPDTPATTRWRKKLSTEVGSRGGFPYSLLLTPWLLNYPNRA